MKSSKISNRKTAKLEGNSHKENNNNENREQICDICAQNVPGPEREKIFAFGKCDHYVCYVCSARLRVICEQSECPICREKLDNVVFTSNRNQLYERLRKQDCLFDKKYNIYFENKNIKDAFDKLLKYECQECLKGSKQTKSSNNTKKTTNDVSPGVAESIEEDGQGLLEHSDVVSKVFPDVFGLRNHLNYVHKLKLCELCLLHNKLFPFEYSYYDNAGLKKHMKEGEPKTSHRGHPNCVLCHNTFFNTDELIQHMSREHFHCHLCGRHDSNMRIYFPDYNSLRGHFKTKHFLCERDHCRHEQFTSAFDNRIDYQLHMVQAHGNPTSGMSRGEARQQRTITLDSAPHRTREISPGRSMRQDLPRNAAVVSTGFIATSNRSRQPQNQQQQLQQQQLILPQQQQRLPSRDEFPALGQSSTSHSQAQIVSSSSSSSYIDHYPSLAFNQRVIAGPSGSNFVRTTGGLRGYNEMDFPPLPEQPKPKVKGRRSKLKNRSKV